MKALEFRKHMNVSIVNLVFVFMFVLPCVVSAQDGSTFRYRVVEDPGHHLFSQQNLQLAFALAFDPERFNELWPRYGYQFNAVSRNLTSLCGSGNPNRNMGIGRSAIARLAPSNQDQDQGVLMALPIENNTNPSVIHDFLGSQGSSNDQSTWSYVNHDSAENFSPVTIDSICEIIPDNSSDALDSAVIVTQHPLPIPERYSYRLLPEEILVRLSPEGFIERPGEIAQ